MDFRLSAEWVASFFPGGGYLAFAAGQHLSGSGAPSARCAEEPWSGPGTGSRRWGSSSWDIQSCGARREIAMRSGTPAARPHPERRPEGRTAHGWMTGLVIDSGCRRAWRSHAVAGLHPNSQLADLDFPKGKIKARPPIG